MTTAGSERLGIDLGGTKIEAILLADNGEVTHRLRQPTPANNYEATLAAITEIADQIEKMAGIERNLPIGIGTPGAVSVATGLMKNCNSTCLNDQPLREDLARLSGRDVRIANDADCFALSEASDGAAAGASSVFGVILGTGVGGGIVSGGRLLAGINAIAGEWGHNPLPLNAYPEVVTPGRACYCGRVDCIETWLSGPGFAMSYNNRHNTTLTAVEIADLARQGDDAARTVLTEYTHLLALALATVINVLDPEAIVLGGGMSNIASLYEDLPGLLPRYVFSDRVDTRVLPNMHGDASGVRGAAWLWQAGESSSATES